MRSVFGSMVLGLFGVALLACDPPLTTSDAAIDADLRDAAGSDAAPADAARVDDAAAIDDGGAAIDAWTADDASVVAPDAGPPSVVDTYRVWVWNVAGNLFHEGAIDTGMIEVAAASIVNRDADFVGFNELCESQYRALQSALRAAGWPADSENFARFSETRAAGTGPCGGAAYGNAIFSREPLGSADRIVLPTDGSREHRSLLCAPLAARPHMRFCTTHITTSSALADDGLAHNSRQLRAVLAQLESYRADGDTVLIAGDFNAQPHYARLDRFYSSSLDVPVNSGNVGQYRELDDDDAANCLGHGEVTVGNDSTGGPCGTGVKIDLIFVREDRLAGSYSADSLSISEACGGPCSDHRILIGEVTVRVEE